ncbi:MAG: hypothetical protein AAF517_26000, partial [Planctomycetota bacterium]
KAEIWYLKVAALYASHQEVYSDAAKNLVKVYTALGQSKRASEWSAKVPKSKSKSSSSKKRRRSSK